MSDATAGGRGATDEVKPDLGGPQRLLVLWRGRALGVAVLLLCLLADTVLLAPPGRAPHPAGAVGAAAAPPDDSTHCVSGRTGGEWLGAPQRAGPGAVSDARAALRLLFDSYQSLSPREVVSNLPIIVAVDEKSLAALGQWPWPRDQVARLIDRIGEAGAAAIGVDVLFLEPDRHSPARMLEALAEPPAAVRRYLESQADHDLTLAAAIARWPVVLGLAGTHCGLGLGGPPRVNPIRFEDAALTRYLPRFPGADQTIAPLSRAALGQGLLNAIEERDAIVRRVPTVGLIGETPAPSFAIEVLHAALGGDITVHGDADGIAGITVGDWPVPTEFDGSIIVPFSPPFANRYVSAIDVLEDPATHAKLEGAVVLVGLTGQGLTDHKTIPLHYRVPGIDVHAQVIEAIDEQVYISRPAWARPFEIALLVVVGALFIFVVPIVRPRYGLPIVLATLLATVGGGYAAFALDRVIVDTTGPLFTGVATGVAMLASTLLIANAHRRALGRHLQREREAQARLQGELDAAREIQLGLLPRAEELRDADGRFSLAAMLEPALNVGGDLYDFFKIDDDRLFVAIGDVSGKGVPASLFMAISKALYKSAVLRGAAEIGEIMGAANEEISRENPNMLFVTMFAGILDLRTGVLDFCNAGHEPPLLFRPGEAARRLEGGGGPPLCVMDDFPYMAESVALEPGETLLLTTDGVGEAMNEAGELYGEERLLGLLRGLPADADATRAAIYQDVKAHAAGAPPSDDITIVVVAWTPPAGSPARP